MKDLLPWPSSTHRHYYLAFSQWSAPDHVFELLVTLGGVGYSIAANSSCVHFVDDDGILLIRGVY